MDQSNELGDGVNYLQVTISDVGDDIAFSVQTLPALTGLTPLSNFGIQTFSFNVNGPLCDITSAANIVGLSSTDWDIKYNKNASEFGKFDILYKGTGSDRVDPLEFLIINDDVADGVDCYAVANTDGNFFASHVAGFTAPGGVTSAFFASDGTNMVPIPGAVWLLGSGLVGLISLRRQRP